MAQNKLNDFANRLSKGPTGVNFGIKILAMTGAAVYGVSQSMYTGIYFFLSLEIFVNIC